MNKFGRSCSSLLICIFLVACAGKEAPAVEGDGAYTNAHSETTPAPAPEKKTEKLVAFGDSNTEQLNIDDPSARWPSLVDSEFESLEVINAGIGGNNSHQAVARLSSDVIGHSPDTVLVMFGTNDAVMVADGVPTISKNEFKSNITYIVNEISSSGGTPILMTTIPLIEGDESHGLYSRHPASWYESVGGAKEWFSSYNEILREVALAERTEIIDVWNEFMASAGNASDEALLASDLLDASGTHMSELGSALTGSLVLNALGSDDS